MKPNLNPNISLNFSGSDPQKISGIVIVLIALITLLISSGFAVSTFLSLNKTPTSLATQQAINQRLIQQATSLLEENTLDFSQTP